MSLVKFEQVSINRNKKIIIENLSLELDKGSILAIAGRSGIGKSTVLESFINKKLIKSGKILAPNTISFMPQSIDEKEVGLSVIELITLSKSSKGFFIKKNEYNLAQKVLKELNLEEKKNKLLAQLSGGELQRFSIARAIYQNYNLFILDEPTAGADIKTSLEIKEIISKYAKSKNKTIIYSTHDLNLIKGADYILYIKANGEFIYGKNSKEMLEKLYDGN